MPDAQLDVVIPFYDQQRQLDLLLTALEWQTRRPDLVVVADDGSRRPPETGTRSYPVHVVTQPDAGFRAAGARNLGAGAGHATLLAFLDADMLPEPAYLARLAEVLLDGEGDRLVVGRRRHADLSEWRADDVARWLAGRGPGPVPLPEPSWLADGYRATEDLARAGDDGYQYVISAVLALHRSLFERVGGFDEGFVGYGGEDWDLGHRCWLAGADFRHVSGAVAWHDGPDLTGRPGSDASARKDRETVRVAQTVTHPRARDPRLWWRYPRIAVSWDPVTTSVAETVLTCAAVLAGSDAALWLSSGAEVLADPRISSGSVPRDVRGRCLYQVRLQAPVTLDRPLDEICAAGSADYDGLVTIRRTRDINRGSPPPPTRPAEPAGIRRLVTPSSLEARWGGWG